MRRDEDKAAKLVTHQAGTISDWNDERGFGWVEADGKRVFVHIKEFGRADRRPKNGEKVRFELGGDAKGRSCATSVVYVRPGGRIGVGS